MSFHDHVSAGLAASPLQTLPIVFVIDADPSVRASLELLIRHAGWRPRMFASAEEFLAHPRVTDPSCLVSEVILPGLGGLELQRLLAEQCHIPIVFLTGHGDVSTTVRAMKAGAVEFLTKPFEEKTLLDALRSAFELSRVALRQESELRALRERYATLSRREREVMVLVVSGLLNKQVGARLCITEMTVKAHRGKVVRKMGAASLPALVHMAATLGLASPAPRIRFSPFGGERPGSPNHLMSLVPAMS